MSLDNAVLMIIDSFAESIKWEDNTLGLSPEEHMEKQNKEIIALATLLVEEDKEEHHEVH